MHDQDQCCGIEDDLALLDMLTAPTPPVFTGRYKRRDSDLDPLMLLAAATSGPHVTRNHYAHDFFPGVDDPIAEGSYDWTKWQAQTSKGRQERRPRPKYVSRQAPRSQRLGLKRVEEDKENGVARELTDPLRNADNLPPHTLREPQASSSHVEVISPSSSTIAASVTTAPGDANLPALQVKCMARTRVPTPHGPIFLHLYHNNRDNKEHLAIVVDPAQLESEEPVYAPAIRSASLDAVWTETETEMDRITRGAYVGRLSAMSQKPSSPYAVSQLTKGSDAIPPPLIRIHSECFTGETIGSMRCDCGEQLDEAIRQISQPIKLPSATIPGRGAVIYMRQEGRGIGLLSKIRAYNLQDLGHDTVTANLMLGHKADERGYEIAGAILRDLGLGSETGEGVRLLTNNPDKVQALEQENVRIVARVPMVPRSWQSRHADHKHDHDNDVHIVTPGEEGVTPKGATMIGGGAVYGDDLEKYLRTKVLRMGHMLPLLGEDGLFHDQ